MNEDLAPKGPSLDAQETRMGTEDFLATRAKAHMQEAMASRSDAINALSKAKANLGHVVVADTSGVPTTDWDKKMDAKFGINDGRPTSAGGRVN